jgi:hypothetical protein
MRGHNVAKKELRYKNLITFKVTDQQIEWLAKQSELLKKTDLAYYVGSSTR